MPHPSISQQAQILCLLRSVTPGTVHVEVLNPQDFTVKETMHVCYIGWGFQAECTPFKVLISSCALWSQEGSIGSVCLIIECDLSVMWSGVPLGTAPCFLLCTSYSVPACMRAAAVQWELVLSASTGLTSCVFHVCSVLQVLALPHFADEETEAHGSEIPHQDPKACKSPWDSHMSNSKTHLLNPLLGCWEDPLEKEMATHSSTLAWKIPWMEEPGKLQPMESQRAAVLSPFQDVHPQHRLLWPLFSLSLASNSDFSPKGVNLFFFFFVSKSIKSPSFGVFYSTFYVVFSSSF